MTDTDFEDIKLEIKEINKKVTRLLELLETDCKKMSNHIDFVENIYESVKTPFTYIMDSVNRISENRFINNT
jgi:hypothetical protein